MIGKLMGFDLNKVRESVYFISWLVTENYGGGPK